MKKLRDEQERLIVEYFHASIKPVDFQKELESREEHRKWALNMFEKSKLKDMTEIGLGELISNLWATRMWGNKDYLVQKIIEDNGIDKIIAQFDNMLYGTDPFEKRFERFKIKGLGPASLTEILCFFDPKKFSIWNDKARIALKKLKFDDLPLGTYRISGEEYERINETMTLIAQKLQDLGLSDVDLLAVDYFLYEVWYTEKEKIKPKEKIIEERSGFDHDEIKEFIKEIGVQLGFEADTEKLVARGAQVDVIWRVMIANLGAVTYIFEVHRKGSIDSLILNLQRALNNPTVQKIIAVSDKIQLEKIRDETKSLPENFRKALTFWEVSDVMETHEKLSEAIQSISKLELVRSQFEE
ncbi:MAG: hypothetical protein WA977_08685 [Halobacteriota archaeon]